MERATFAESTDLRRPAHGGVLVPRATALRTYAWVKLAVAATDVAAVVGATFLAWTIRHPARGFHAREWTFVVIATALYLAVFAVFRLYSLTQLSPAEEFRRIIAAVSVAVSALVVVGFWSRERYTRLFIALLWILALVLTMVGRRVWHWWMSRAKASGRLAFRTLIVGTNEEARRLMLAMEPAFVGFRPIGFVPTESSRERLDGLTAFGNVATIQEAIRDSGADCVFVASTAVSPVEMTRITRAVRLQGVEVRVSANLSEILSTRLTVQPVGGLMALSLNPVRLSGLKAAAKRTMDVGIAALLLALSIPLWLVVAAAIKLDSRGPVLYPQERVGRRGRPFRMLKFRTMVDGAERMLEELRPLNEATGPLFKLRQDPRTTRVGRRLRKWSLDELPQLWNVLTGEMSLVGPRPPLAREVASYEDWHYDRLEVRPGITGLWQVRGRSQLPFDDYVRLDLFYIENWSISFDLFILAKTIPAILTRKGAF